MKRILMIDNREFAIASRKIRSRGRRLGYERGSFWNRWRVKVGWFRLELIELFRL